MKTSKWTTNPAAPVSPTRFTICHAGPLVQVTLKRRDAGGLRILRLVMTKREADELAASIATPEPRVVRRV